MFRRMELPTEPIASPSRPRVLLADKHSDMRQYLTRILSEHYEIHAADDVSTALILAREWDPDIVVADVGMRASDQFNFLRMSRRDAWGKVPIVFYSTNHDEDSSVNAAEIAATDDLVMPFSERPLLALVHAQLRVAEMRQQSIQ